MKTKDEMSQETVGSTSASEKKDETAFEKKNNQLPFQCLLADVDGTLVNERRVMGELTKQVLMHLQKKGIRLGIASGRPLDELPMTTARFHCNVTWDFLIGMNGGEVYDGLNDTTHVIYQLQGEALKNALELFWDQDYVVPVIYKGHALLAKEWIELLEISKKHAHKEALISDRMEDFMEEPTGKIMLRTITPEDCDRAEAYYNAHPSKDFVAFKTQATLLELQDPRINKGVALKKIAELHHWDPEDIAAFGDASNDNEMLKAAGLGVCLCNGLPDTIASADELTEYDNEQDGLARYLLKKFPELFADFSSPVPAPEDGYFAPSEMPTMEEARAIYEARQQETAKEETNS